MTIEREQELLKNADWLLANAWDGNRTALIMVTEAAANVALAAELRARRGDWPRTTPVKDDAAASLYDAVMQQFHGNGGKAS